MLCFSPNPRPGVGRPLAYGREACILPSESTETVRDTMSVEIFVNHGKRYFMKTLPPADPAADG